MDCLRTRCGHPVVPTCEGLAGCKAQGLWGGFFDGATPLAEAVRMLYGLTMRKQDRVQPVPLLANGRVHVLSPGIGCRKFSVSSLPANYSLDFLKPYALKALPNFIEFGSICIFPCHVDPELAKKFLERNLDNRKLRTSVVAKYACDMSDGKWQMTPTAICFDCDGKLGNGQHTLNAIVNSGNSQYLLIAYNVPRESIAMMDVGLTRTFQDIAHFVGKDLDSPSAAIAKIMKFGYPANSSKTALSFETVYGVYQQHKDAIDFAILATNAAKVTGVNAITRSVVAMAWYTQDRKRLSEFLECLKTGVTNGKGDTAALRLRDLFMKGGLSVGGSQRIEMFHKTKSALEHFLSRKPISKLYGTDKNLFPYPHS